MERLAFDRQEDGPRRICVIKPSALGDVVQSLPFLAALRSRWPQAQIAWVIHRGLAGLLERQPDLDRLIEFDRAAQGWQRLGATCGLARSLSACRFDLTIDLQGLARTGLMTLATRAPWRVGFANAREGAATSYTERIVLPEIEIPAWRRYWRVAQALGCKGDPPRPRLGISPAARSWAAARLAGLPRPVIAMHPGAQWETKRWPAARFAAVAAQAQRELGAGIVLLGGRGEGGICREIASRLDRPPLNLAERTSLLELAAVSESANLFVSGDTGPMHLAAAVGTPVVGIFTCTSPVRAGPWGAENRIVATRVACAASYLRRCDSLICMAEVTPDRVWSAVAELAANHLSGPARRGAAA